MKPSEIVGYLLQQRGIAPDAINRLLKPDFVRDLHDASIMKGMSVAVDRIRIAIDTQEKITIFGDYDADGVPATALLIRGFKRLGVEVNPIIPTRASGYGLNMEAVEYVRSVGTKLLITVDNGTVSKEEIAALKAYGIDTIVCDHHEPQEGHLADSALAILNPKQADCPYPHKELCGCSLAWKLMGCLYRSLGQNEDVLKWDLDLVALSTVADMMPLTDENRVLVTYGMKVMKKSRNKGLLALAAVAGIDLGKVGVGTVSFQFAPRINAPSRMHNETVGQENVSLTLLTTGDETEAARLAGYLNERNVERQALLDSHLHEAMVQAETKTDSFCLVLYGEQWSSGVIGLVAGRMLEQYKRPVIALAMEDGFVKGSVRSVDGVSTVDMLAAGAEFLSRYGGHAKAGGLTMHEGASITGFEAAVNAYVSTQGWTLESLKEASLKQSELDLSVGDVTLELAEALEALEPFGIGWPSPLVRSRCIVTGVKKVGAEGTHLSCQLAGGPSRLKGIAFGQGQAGIVDGREYDVIYTLEADEWNGERRVSCHIKRFEAIS